MLTPSHRPTVQFIGSSIVALICIAVIGLLQVPQLNELRRLSTVVSPALIQRQLETQKVQLNLLTKLPTFGFDNIVADWTFLNFLQYFGDEAVRQQTDYSLSPDFFEVVLNRNPNFLEAYTFLSTSTALYAGMPDRSIDLMNRGLKSLAPDKPPGSYFVWRNKGIDELLFLGDAQAANQSFTTAAEWASQSSLPGSAQIAAISRLTAQFLATNPNSKTAQVAAWTMVLNNAPDNRTRRIAINRIQSLGGQVLINSDGAFQIVPPTQD